MQTQIPRQLDELDAERMRRYAAYLDFYNGQQWSGRRRQYETRLTFNYARALVQKSASYLFPRQVRFDVLADRPEQERAIPAAELALQQVYAEHDQHTIDVQSALDSAVLGDGAFKVTWSARRNSPLIAPVDPANLWAWWEPDNPNEVYRVVQRHRLLVEEAQRLFPSLTITGNPQHQVTVLEDWTTQAFVVQIDGQVKARTANPYGFIPYVIYPNMARPHEFWGASDLEDLLDVCRELNLRMSTMARLLQVSGYPITVLENATLSETLRAEAGAIWELPEDSKAYLLDMLGNGAGIHIDYINLLYRQLHDLSETPRTAFGDSGRALSGVALEVEIQPLLQKVMRKRRFWDAVFRRRNARVLALLEQFGGLDLAGLRRTEPLWPEVLPSDRTALVDAEARLVATGIHSRRQAAAQLGDADPERTWQAVLDERNHLRLVEDD